MTPVAGWSSFEYVVLRWVPRAEREEHANVGVVLHCRDADFLAARCHLDRPRLEAFAPGADLDSLGTALSTLEAVCRGDASAGPPATLSASSRFGWLAAPRSTALRPGPVHGGRTRDPAATLEDLLAAMVL